MIYRPTRGELAMLESMLDEPRAPTRENRTAARLVEKKLAKWYGDELRISEEGVELLLFMGKKRK